MSTHVSGFRSFFSVFLHPFVLAKLASSSIRVELPENGIKACAGFLSVQLAIGGQERKRSLLPFASCVISRICSKL